MPEKSSNAPPMPAAAPLRPASDERDPVRETVETIAELHRRHVNQFDSQQRGIEKATGILSRPRFLYFTAGFVAVWIVLNAVLAAAGHAVVDRPPFNWLALAVGLMALLLTSLVVITQNRQDRSAERRSQLDLQVSILIDQKVSKLIALIEELRRDLPNVHDRRDPEAEKLVQSTDMNSIVDELNNLLDEVEREPGGSPPAVADGDPAGV